MLDTLQYISPRFRNKCIAVQDLPLILFGLAAGHLGSRCHVLICSGYHGPPSLSISIFFPHNRGHMALRRKIMSRWVLLPSANHKRPRWTEWIYERKGKTENMVSINILHQHPSSWTSSNTIQHHHPSFPEAPSTSPNQVSNCQHFVQESLQELARRLSDLGLMAWYIWIHLVRLLHLSDR